MSETTVPGWTSADVVTFATSAAACTAHARQSGMTYDAPAQRCSYCAEAATAFVRDGRYGRDTTVCEEHVSKAVDALLPAPALYRIPSGDAVTIRVNWWVE